MTRPASTACRMLPYGEGDRPEDTGDLEAEFTDPDGNTFLLHS